MATVYSLQRVNPGGRLIFKEQGRLPRSLWLAPQGARSRLETARPTEEMAKPLGAMGLTLRGEVYRVRYGDGVVLTLYLDGD